MLAKEDIKPLGNMVLYEVIVEDRKTQAGLFLPGDADAETLIVGKVVEVGELVFEKTRIKKEDKILLNRGVSTKVPLGDAVSKSFVCLVEDRHILAKV